MADTKLAILKAMINDALTELMVKTRIDNVFMTDETTTLASKLAEIIQAVNIREKIEDVDNKISAAKEEVNKNASDNLATAKSELNERIDNLTYEDVGATTEAYVDQQILLVTETGIPKLMVYPLPVTATEDNQTIFPIDLDTFDPDTDTVLVQSGRTMLFPQLDYTISEGNVVLTEGVPVDRVIGIYVMKNVPLGDDGSVSGSVIGTGSLPLDRLEELPTAEQVGAIPSEKIGQAAWCDDLFERHDVPTLVQWGGNTANTPLEAGFTQCEEGFAIIYGDITGWHTVLAWQKGGDKAAMWMHIYDNGFDTGWHDMTAFLPLTGGTLSGLLQVTTSIGFSLGEASDYGTGELQLRIKDRTNNANIRYISMDDMTLMPNMSDALKLVDFKDGYYTSRKIFGEHNKPSGSYTGNGSATERTINIGGLQGMNALLYIYDSYTGNHCIVSRAGGLWWNGSTVSTFSATKINFVDGVLHIASTDGEINGNGKTYHYREL